MLVMDDMYPKYIWIFGVFLAALGSVISNLGVSIQKLTHLKYGKTVKNGKKKEIWKHGLWWLGLSLVVVGSMADFSALSFTPQSLVAPLGSMTLVSNVIFAPYLLNEKITKRDLMGTATILVGSVVTVVFADHNSVPYRSEEIFSFFFKTSFQVYAVLVTAFIIGLLAFTQYMEQYPPHSAYFQSKVVYLRFAFPSMAGAIGAQSVLFAKCSVEMISNTMYGTENAFKYWQTYVLIMAMFVTVILQVTWINRGLRYFDTSYMVPVFQAFWIPLSVMSGLIFFQEMDDLSSTSRYLFCLGVLITIGGVATLSGHRNQESTTLKPHRPYEKVDMHDDDDALFAA